MVAPTQQEVVAYLASAGLKYGEPAVASALKAELAAQARVCRVGEPMQDDLAEALMRRVARNLTMRALPLGVQSDDLGGSTVLGSNDAEVRRLEKPYRKVVMG